MYDLIREGTGGFSSSSSTSDAVNSSSTPGEALASSNTAEAAQSGSGSGSVTYAVRCQFLEIYGEEINDLLDPAGGQVQTSCKSSEVVPYKT